MQKEMIDLHVHGMEGFDTRGAGADTMLRIAALQGEAGVSKMLLSLYPAPIPVMRRQMAAVREAMKRQADERPAGDRADASVRPGAAGTDGAARILGVHLEGPFLNPSRCGALDAGALLPADEKAFGELLEGFEEVVRTMTVAPELPGAPGLIRNATDRGLLVCMGHSDATYEEAQAGFAHGARGITHLFNAMRGLHHREPGIAGFGLLHREVYVEVIGDLRHMSAQTLSLVFRMKDPSRIILVSDAVAGTRALAPSVRHGEDEKLVGGTLSLPVAAAGLVKSGFDPDAITRAVSTNPGDFLKLGR